MKPVKKGPADWTAEDIASFWDWQSINASRHGQYFTASMAPGIVRFLKKNNLLKGAVLDYGCGTGYLLEQMAKEKDVDLYGLDFSADSIAASKNRTGHNSNLKQLVLANKLPSVFRNAQFDTITVVETIEHLQDDQLKDTFVELGRILKPGGAIFITTPFNEDLDRHLIFCPFCKSEFHHMQHMQSFSIDRLTALGKEHGFIVKYCSNINIEKFKIGAIRFYIKSQFKKIGYSFGLMEKRNITAPNLIAIFLKP